MGRVNAGYIYRVTSIVMSACHRHSNTTGGNVELLRTLTRPFTQLIIQVRFGQIVVVLLNSLCSFINEPESTQRG